MKLLRLTLTNFKGIRNLDIFAQGKNLAVFGDNGAGKTTIVDAFLWLLTGKDSEGRKDFEIKTLDSTGEPILNLEHTVEGSLDSFNLKRTFREKWTKKRGSAEAEFTGHETLYFVDEVPCSEKDYIAKIASIMTEEEFRLLADPYYFNEKIKWQDRRKKLLEVCGGVDLAELISSDPRFNEIPTILNSRTVEDTKKVIAAQKKKINDRLNEIPARIDEAHKSMSLVSEQSENQLREEDKLTADKVAAINDAKARLMNGGAAIEIKNKLADINAQMSKIKATEDANYTKAVSDLVTERTHAVNAKFSNRNSLDMALSNKKRYQSELDANVKERDTLRKKYSETADQTFECSVESVCPTCGQDLPEEKVL
jgi:DNA repair exonuclease SbcCD ATPase subunit